MNFLVRTLGGSIILVVLIAITVFGEYSLAIGMTILSMIGVREVMAAFNRIGIKPFDKLVYASNLLIMLAAASKHSDLYSFAIIGAVVFVLLDMVFNTHKDLEDHFATLFVIMYVSVLMSNILRIEDINYVYILYITAWGTDTFAYLVGSAFGKKKIDFVAHISPNKTLEGSIGGILGAIALNMIYIRATNLKLDIANVIIFTIIGSILSQVGDLVASYIKRKTGVKDFGNIIPGHGGIMDRFDSMLFIAPLLYLFSII